MDGWECGDMLGPVGQEMMRRLRDMPVDEKERVRREITGEADKDLIAKRDVYAILADEIIASASSFARHDIQRALRNVRNAVSKKERFKGELTARFGDR